MAATALPSEATEAPATEAAIEYQGPPDSESSGESAETDADISVDLSGKSDVEPTVLATTDLPRIMFMRRSCSSLPSKLIFVFN